MANNKAVNVRIEALEKRMVIIVKAFKERSDIKELKENRNKEYDDGIKEILESKKLIDEILANHTEVFDEMEKEMKSIGSERSKVNIVRTVKVRGGHLGPDGTLVKQLQQVVTLGHLVVPVATLDSEL